MFKHQGIWLPDGEKHFPEWMTKNGELVDGRGTYQIKKLREALKHVKQFRTAIDVGGHVGLWAIHLAPRFKWLYSFEPMPEFRDCYLQNVKSQNVTVHQIALGSEAGKVRMEYDPADSGGTHVGKGLGEVSLQMLDSFKFTDVDFIKIDCEGFELEVLKGAEEIISRDRPCIIVEQKPHKLEANYGTKGAPAVDHLKKMGYEVAKEMSGDYIMVPK